MTTQIEEDAYRALEHLVERVAEVQQQGNDYDTGVIFASAEEFDDLGLSPGRLNDAVAFLEANGYADILRTFGTAPYTFRGVSTNARGRHEYQRRRAAREAVSASPDRMLPRAPTPVGSPYGFAEQDWEYVEEEKRKGGALKVVIGLQFDSDHYETALLLQHLEAQLSEAVRSFNASPVDENVELSFKPLSAGYGEHLFNEIAREIISADIAIFETSDLNPNVMIELGIALTWGVRVLPIKVEGRPSPPSDISGQTWADYSDHGSKFVNLDHAQKLETMVRRVVRRKRGAINS